MCGSLSFPTAHLTLSSLRPRCCPEGNLIPNQGLRAFCFLGPGSVAPSCEPAHLHHSTLCSNVSSSETCSDILSEISASHRPSLEVQWLRIHLQMQETQVQSLVRELRSHMPRGNQVCAPHLLSPCALSLHPLICFIFLPFIGCLLQFLLLH